MAQFIPKEEIKEKESPIVKAFFWFCILLFLASCALTYVAFWKLGETKNILTDVENQISQFGTEKQTKSKDNVFSYKKKLDDIATILQAHKVPTKVFGILERNMHPKVTINSMSFSSYMKESRMSLDGFTTDLVSLAQQIKQLQDSLDIEKVSMPSISTNDEKINFKVDLVLKEASLLMQ